ncbi:MAG: PIG-L deacetylase family protein [Clostridia bacterium]
MSDFIYYDLRRRRGKRDIEVLFPDWQGQNEKLMVLSPHDDDALLGAGYAMAACAANGGEVYVCIFCDGRAGYSREDQKDTIVAVRKEESLRAHRSFGIPEDHVFYMDYPDFSLISYIGWKLNSGAEGTLKRVISLLRSLGITRLMIPNGYNEHIDHQATYDIGRYDGVQAGDPVAVDWGKVCPIQSTVQYAVWGDLSPEDALLNGDDLNIRANRAIVADYEVEERVEKALREFQSQGEIIKGLMEARRQRDCGNGMIELYIHMDPRPRLDYGPYVRLIPSLPVE